MTLNGKEVIFKLTNAATAERYEQALKNMQDKGEELEKHPLEGLAANIRAQIDMVREFVDTIFGPGEWEILETDHDDLDENIDLVEQIIQESERQKDALQRRVSKYDPRRNKRGRS